MNEVDKTINSICEWVQHGLEQSCNPEELAMLSEMIKSLAELVSAREKYFCE